MPYVYPQANTLEKKPKVGNTDCVALVRHYAGVPEHRSWKAGAKVLDNKDIKPGTAIATFVNGKYPSKPRDNHAAFFLRHGPAGDGFWVIDQWNDKGHENKKPTISSRYIQALRRKQYQDGSWFRASDNADAFSIIDLR